jgi:hypothetical protein
MMSRFLDSLATRRVCFSGPVILSRDQENNRSAEADPTGGARRIVGTIAIAIGSLLSIDSGARAQEVPPATTRPMLAELDRETQSLYQDVAQGIVRVQLPLRSDALSGQEDPLDKWRQRLDPAQLRRLDELSQHAPAGTYMRVDISPATQPSDNGPQQHLILLTLSGFTPNSMGVVVDDQGHVMVPHYVDREAFTDPVPMALADGKLALATFVGSDRQTDLTVLKINNVKSKGLAMGDPHPSQGALMLVISLNPGFNRMAVWAGAEPDLAVVASPDGSIAGFTWAGRFRPAAFSKPIVQELIDHGRVRRALLGVVIDTVPADDPQRKPEESLRDAPALRIQKVIPGSIAERAGLQPGDLILKLAGESVSDAPAFAAAIAKSRGATEMVILREGRQISVTVDLQVP